MSIADEHTDKKGKVVIAYHLGHFNSGAANHSVMYEGGIRAMHALPVRNVTFHYCMSDSRYRPLISFVINLFPQDMRAKVKLHFGTFAFKRGFPLDVADAGLTSFFFAFRFW